MKVSDLKNICLNDEIYHVSFHLNNWLNGEDIDPDMIPVMIKSLANLQLASIEKQREDALV
ncbi:hypothetical protein [Acinetobacter sp. Q22-2]|uniref:hypothetical protein n=1 Tax=Acinetobacter sp. Q22-2 TaxID=2601014 RepID=UPI0015D27F23|nr:hypothetical protein [Acinetobacter sp. Q22-2]